MTLTSQANATTPAPTASATTSPTLEASPTREDLLITTAPAQDQDIIVNPFSTACDDSVYISDVTIPDGTELSAGETFTKTWLVRNTGSCTWSENYALVFIDGADMGGATTAIGASVSPWEQAEISVYLIAPDTKGLFTGYWVLMNEEGETFGTSIFVQIAVTEDAATSTPTETPTSTEEDTSTPSPTATP